MGRLPRIIDYGPERLLDGSRKCRNCEMPVAKGRRNYCSESCMREFFRNHTWALVRKDVLKRDRYRCSICSQRFLKSQLDVDHMIPIRMGGDPFNKNNLRTLCKDCHKAKSRLESWALSETQSKRGV